MSELGRILVASAQRVDLQDVLSIDSFTGGDWKYFIRSLIGEGKTYVLKGFDVIDPQNAIGTQSLSIKIADSVLYYPDSGVSSFYYGLEEGNAYAEPLVPELRKSATNYVYATFDTFEAAGDSRAFWDPDLNGGEGGEFTQEVNTESVLKVDINVSTTSFPDNTVPICVVVVNTTVIESIQDARPMLFRLGLGGIAPDPFNTFSFRELPSATYKRSEPATTMLSVSDPNSFQGGDKNIYSLKEWMDAVMTKLKELGGSTYWYEDIATYSLINLFIDSVGSTFKSKGYWQHSASTPGLVTWSADLHIQNISDQRDVIVRKGNATLTEDQVLYVETVRDADINAFSFELVWGTSTYGYCVNGNTGYFNNVKQGDWIKPKHDPNSYYRQIEELYTDVNLGGTPGAAPSLAKSVRLGSVYPGTIGKIERGVYTQGVYESSEVQIADRGDDELGPLGNSMVWLALRSDTTMKIASIVPTTLTINISEANGTTVKCTTVAPHGLEDGDQITIESGSSHAGTYAVEKESTTVFYIHSTGLVSENNVLAYFATVTTTTRTTSYGLELEDSNHNFETDQTIILKDTGSSYGTTGTAYRISVRSATTFTIPVPNALAGTVTAGTATLPKVNVRTEVGQAKLIQGETHYSGEIETANIESFIGMQAVSETHPNYFISDLSYTTLRGRTNYNANVDDNLTERVSKLTAMMADKAQDKTIKFLPYNTDRVTNTQNGAHQEIRFSSLAGGISKLNVVLPSSENNGTLTLNSGVPLSDLISLSDNEAAYITIDRNGSFTVANLAAVSVEPITDTLLSENIFVVAVRLDDNDVWLWDGTIVENNDARPIASGQDEIARQDRNLMLVGGENWSWNVTSHTVSISSAAYIDVPGLNKTRNTISAGSFVLTDDGDVAYVNINRDAGAAAILTVNVDHISNVDADIDTLIIARRIGEDVWLQNGVFLTKTWIYEESILVDSDLTVDDNGQIEITLPVDSRNSGEDRYYKNGRAEIELYINGEFQQRSQVVVSPTFTASAYDNVTGIVTCPDGADLSYVRSGDIFKDGADAEYFVYGSVDNTIGQKKFTIAAGLTITVLTGCTVFRQDFKEYGSAEDWTNKIILRKNILATSNTILTFRHEHIPSIIGSFGLPSGGGGGTLQDSYDLGNTINVASGRPITITGPAGEKLLSIDGDVEITGVIDPTGVALTRQASHPLGTQDGLWIDTNGVPFIRNVDSGNMELGGRTYEADDDLTKGRAVIITDTDKVDFGDNSATANARVIGITMNDAVSGNRVYVRKTGYVDSGIILAGDFVEGTLPNEGDYVWLGDTAVLHDDLGKLSHTAPVRGSGKVEVFLGIWDNGGLNLQIGFPVGIA
jgi:hypothetical protein